MDPFSVPTSPDVANYTQRTTLDGVAYLLTFRLNQRENTWRFDLALADETPIASGVKVVCGVPLLERFVSLQVPPGVLMAFASSSDESPPGFGELGEGRRVELLYFDKLTLAEIDAEIAAEILAGV